MPKRIKNRLRLFVWANFNPDYTSGLAFAIAENETEARRLIVKRRSGVAPSEWGHLTVRRLDRRFARCVNGGS